MKHLLGFGVLVLTVASGYAISGFAGVPGPRPVESAPVTGVDIDAFIVGYWESPELTFSGSSGIARGFSGVRERYHRNYPDRAAMGELAFSDLEFRFLSTDAALVLGHWHLKRETKGDVGGVFSLVWQRFPDGWKIVHDHTSSVDGM